MILLVGILLTNIVLAVNDILATSINIGGERIERSKPSIVNVPSAPVESTGLYWPLLSVKEAAIIEPFLTSNLIVPPIPNPE